MLTSRMIAAITLVPVCAFALHAAFPRASLPWIAPLALAGLFAAWMMLPPRAAAIAGYSAGLIFFSFDFAWFGETAGALVGPFAFALDLAPAALEAIAFAATAAVVSLAARSLRGAWIPVAGASAFTAAEWLRSIGPIGGPLYQVGAPFIETPLAPLAAYAGVFGLTFVVALGGAVAAHAALERSRATMTVFAATSIAIVLVTAAAWWAWPARTLAPPTIAVAAVQGNIRQSLKWSAPALALAIERYAAMTRSLAPSHPQFVLWPETVIAEDLAHDPAEQRQLGTLAHALGTVIGAGSIDVAPDGYYNAIFYFDARGRVEQTYRKMQLVPFVEYVPGPDWLRKLPGGDLPSHFLAGMDAQPADPVLRVGTLICWESAFSGLAQTEAAAGAQFLAVATDDAWFGASDGPYAHAQLSAVRAVETGRWVVRAAATGISGIIAPDGTWRARSKLDTQTVVEGRVGPPRPTIYARLGPTPVGAGCVLLVIVAFAAGRRPIRR